MAEPVRLRLEESLRPLVPARRRRPEVPVPADGTSTIGHLVESVGIPLTEVGGLRLRGAGAAGGTVSPSYRPVPGDVVEVAPVTWPQAAPAPLRFLLDVHLGTLARRLRLLGLDVAYERAADDPELVAAARAQGRVLLTRDRGLLRRRALPAGALVYSERPDDQAREVLVRFAPALAPFTRCLACGGELQEVGKAEVADRLPAGTRRTADAFSRCRTCGRVFWRGAHAARLDALVAAATLSGPQPGGG